MATDLYSGAHCAVSIRLLLDQLVDSKSEHSLAELAVESQRQSGHLSMPQLLSNRQHTSREHSQAQAAEASQSKAGCSGGSGDALADETTWHRSPRESAQLEDVHARSTRVCGGQHAEVQGETPSVRPQTHLPNPARLPPSLPLTLQQRSTAISNHVRV